MKFREHRGSLADAMKTAVELKPTMSALIDHLNTVDYLVSMVQGRPFTRHDIVIGADNGPDPRIDWQHTHFVSIVAIGVVGMVSCIPVSCDPEAVLNTGAVLDIQPGKYRESERVFDIPLNSPYRQSIDVSIPKGAVPVEPRLAMDNASFAAMDPGATPDQLLIAEVDPQGNIQHIRDVLSRTNWEANPGRTGEDWLKGLRELIVSGESEAALYYLDSIPEELEDMKVVQKGFVTIPDAENMTEAMVDASRGMHLYYIDNGSGVSHQRMREHLGRYAPWAAKHYPEWFREEDGHLTKAGRAILAHALTIAAYRDPEAKRHYFDMADAKPKGRLWDNPFHQRIRLTFKPMVMGEVFDGGGFVLHQRFMAARPVANEELNAQGISRFELILNRSDIPKQHRGMFKSNAMKLTLDLVNEGKEVKFGDVELFTKVGSSTFEVTPYHGESLVMALWMLYAIMILWMLLTTFGMYLMAFFFDKRLLQWGWEGVVIGTLTLMILISIVDSAWMIGFDRLMEDVSFGLTLIVGGHWVAMFVVMMNAERIQEVIGYPIRTR